MSAVEITLKRAYDKWIEPGKMLRLVDTISKIKAHPNAEQLEQSGLAAKYNNFDIVEAHSTNANVVLVKKGGSKAVGRFLEISRLLTLKELHLTLHSLTAYLAQLLDKAYQFIEGACPVEVSIRVRHTQINKLEKMKTKSTDTFDYLFNHFPHLHPSFIMRSMPEGMRYLIKPFCDGRHVKFVMGNKTRLDEFADVDLTTRLLQIKKSVASSIEQGKAHQLPKAVRFARIQLGDTNYSLDSGFGRQGGLPMSVHIARMEQGDASFLLDTLAGNREEIVKETSFVHTGSGKKRGGEVRWGADSLDDVSERRAKKWSAKGGVLSSMIAEAKSEQAQLGEKEQATDVTHTDLENQPGETVPEGADSSDDVSEEKAKNWFIKGGNRRYMIAGTKVKEKRNIQMRLGRWGGVGGSTGSSSNQEKALAATAKERINQARHVEQRERRPVKAKNSEG